MTDPAGHSEFYFYAPSDNMDFRPRADSVYICMYNKVTDGVLEQSTHVSFTRVKVGRHGDLTITLFAVTSQTV